MNRLVKDALVLTAITLISGLLLGLVYEITKEPIAKAQYNARQKAYRAVFEEADHFGEYGGFDAGEAAGILAEGGYPENTLEEVVTALDDAGELLGYVMTVTSHAGYGGDITFSVGIQLDGTLNGYAITSISETAGLGMRATEKAFASQFEGKNAAPYGVTKGSAASDSDIEAISGATVTSKAVAGGVNGALAYFRWISEGGSADE